MLLFTDASETAWGARLLSYSTAGTWTPQERQFHINVLELLAVLRALRSFHHHCRNQRIQGQTDNTTAVAFLRKGGGTHSRNLQNVAWEIFLFCLKTPDSPDVSAYSGEAECRSSCPVPSPGVRLPSAAPACMGDGRPRYGLKRFARIPLPAFRHTTSCSAKDTEHHDGRVHSLRPVLACTTMFSVAVGDDHRPSNHPSTSPGPSHARQPAAPAPVSCRPPPSRLETVISEATSAGFPRNVAEKIAAPIRVSTASVYDSKWTIWCNWCDARKINPCNPTIVNICVFFTDLHEKKTGLSAIRGYRSALNTVFRAKRRLDLVQDDRITNLFKAFGIERPIARRLFPLWDLPKVLRALAALPYEPIAHATLRDLTKKTMFLLALASGKRRSEIAALVADARHLQFAAGNSSVTLLPALSFRSKTQSADRPSEPWTIPSLSTLVGREDDRLLCPVRALCWYLDRTKTDARRGPDSQLFLPLDPAVPTTTPNMVSRLLCNTIFRAYLADGDAADTDNVRITAHEIRALAASWKATNCVSLDEVLRTASWKNATTFTSHYLRDLCHQKEGLYSLGPIVVGEQIITGPPTKSV